MIGIIAYTAATAVGSCWAYRRFGCVRWVIDRGVEGLTWLIDGRKDTPKKGE